MLHTGGDKDDVTSRLLDTPYILIYTTHTGGQCEGRRYVCDTCTTTLLPWYTTHLTRYAMRTTTRCGMRTTTRCGRCGRVMATTHLPSIPWDEEVPLLHPTYVRRPREGPEDIEMTGGVRNTSLYGSSVCTHINGIRYTTRSTSGCTWSTAWCT